MSRLYKTPVVLKNFTDDSANYKPLPAPTFPAPYRLNIATILPDSADTLSENMSFHMVGDTGSVRHSNFQALVAKSLADQINNSPLEKRPAFLYHLGDIVYNHGEAHEYPEQFLKPYSLYDAPIFAIPGNHDADINPTTPKPYTSLEAFMQVFCASEQGPIPFAPESSRHSMVQPNPYWTLETPLARFIGLYPNIVKFGTIDEEQRAWFIKELQYAKSFRHEQALIVCLHHAPYSADWNHGSSLAMIEFLETAFAKTGIYPDLVCSGHVHNYQRFAKQNADGSTTPYLVAGAGGYADLHGVAELSDPRVQPLSAVNKNTAQVSLEAYCDRSFGFLRLDIKKTKNDLLIAGTYYAFPRVFDPEANMQPKVFDTFEIPIKLKHVTTIE
ncbi:metallophosphoesterase [Sphingobacterium sp. UT-1RO-CII-1]|uniref:metallophosphoesterase family protein n=1 Tax=Sphingobacterium sp. UT-1RO-CII-1 TaxID=2995225 RepID=UPI00227B1366|nr:metallophosphoesterase [Sphingobacterium sp. UT-1RO-CII-1]MCY4779138.1 metallophosphoesterase [Sphingobacterium sp. UT-1RO-CII-1]